MGVSKLRFCPRSCRACVNRIIIHVQAPNTELAVKRLVKQTVAATREKGGAAADMDEKTLKRALRQRLKEGTLKNVTVTNDVAIYCR